MVFGDNQQFSRFNVFTIDNPCVTAQDSRFENSSTWRLKGNMLNQAFVAVAIEEDLQMTC